MIIESIFNHVDLNEASRLTGFSLPEMDEIRYGHDLLRSISTLWQAKERLLIQAAELLTIRNDASVIENELSNKNLKRAVGYGILTGGFKPPDDVIDLGRYGEYPFTNFPLPEIEGHEGRVFAIRINDEGDYFLAMTGRAHPNEWFNNPYGNIIVAHQLRVVHELARRQRADNGVNPFVFLSYMAGVAPGYKMKPGDAGIIVSNTEASNFLHPGAGPIGLFDQNLGPHFQSTIGRNVNVDLAKMYIELAKAERVNIFPVALEGGPHTPEFETYEDLAGYLIRFNLAKKLGLDSLGNLIFGENGSELLTPTFGMGNPNAKIR